MANLGLKSITFPNNLTYTIPEVDNTLSIEGAAAEVVAVKEALEGKAPAGYGLGGTSSTLTRDANAVTGTGWHNCDVNTPDNSWWYGQHIQYDNGYAYQRFVRTDTGYVVERTQIAGVWQPWEWDNPPMLPGVEYRTTERFLGKVVYVKTYDLGECGQGNTRFSHGLNGYYKVRYFAGVTPFFATLTTIPNEYDVWVSVEGSDIVVHRPGNFSERMYCTIYYIKD